MEKETQENLIRQIRSLEEKVDGIDSKVEEGFKDVMSKLEVINESVESIKDNIDNKQEKIIEKQNEIKSGLKANSKKMDQLNMKVDSMSDDLKSIKSSVTEATTSVNATVSDFSGALKKDGEEPSVNRYDEEVFKKSSAEDCYSTVEFIKDFFAKKNGKENSKDPSKSFVAKDVKNPNIDEATVRAQPNYKISDKAFDVSDNSNSMMIKGFQKERDLIVEEVERKTTIKMSQNIKNKAKQKGSPLNQNEVLKVYDKMAESLEEDFPGAGKHITKNALINLNRNKDYFVDADFELLKDELKEIDNKVKQEIDAGNLEQPNQGIWGKIKSAFSEAGDFNAYEEGYKSKSGSIADYAKMIGSYTGFRLTSTFFKETMRNFDYGDTVETTFKDFKDMIKGNSDRKKLSSEIGNFVSDNIAFVSKMGIEPDTANEILDADEKLRKIESHDSLSMESDLDKEICNAACATALTILHKECYQSTTEYDIYLYGKGNDKDEAENKKQAQKVLGILAAHDHPTAKSYHNGDFDMSKPLQESAFDRIHKAGLDQQMSQYMNQGAREGMKHSGLESKNYINKESNFSDLKM